MTSIPDLVFKEIRWQRPIEIDNVISMLIHLAGLSPRGFIVWEIRCINGKIRYLLGMSSKYIHRVEAVFRAHGDVRFYKNCERKEMNTVNKIRLSHPTLSLNTDITTATIRAVFSAMAGANKSEETCIQIILGASYSPEFTRESDLRGSLDSDWLSVLLGRVSKASATEQKAFRDKQNQTRFECLIRVGTTATNPYRVNNILAALRTMESAGAHIYSEHEDSNLLNTAHLTSFLRPNLPLELSGTELATLLMLPYGAEEYCGTYWLHPKEILPPVWLPQEYSVAEDRCVAVANDANESHLVITPQDSLEHTHLLGGTGSGKSTAMLHLIMADINAGRSVLVIDPKNDLVTDILARIPESRIGDVVVMDPSDPMPVGFNPLDFKAYGNQSLIADAILSVFQQIFKDNWGIRSQDFLSAALLTLADMPDANLLWLPPLLTDESFRKNIVSKVRDKVALLPFWEQYESLKDSERRAQIDPVLNKMRQFLYRPGLRNVLGQSHPKFDYMELYTKRKIVLVPLNKGIIGSESAKLLGSLIIGLTWTLALSRADIPKDKRHIISVFIDELQDYVALPTDLSDALAQARGLGVGMTLSHQYLAQLPPDLRAGVEANTRNKIVFGLNAADAKSMAAQSPELEDIDFMSLPRYGVYCNLQYHGRSTGWVRGTTRPAPKSIHLPAEIKARSQSLYGIPAEKTEKAYLSRQKQLCQNQQKRPQLDERLSTEQMPKRRTGDQPN